MNQFLTQLLIIGGAMLLLIGICVNEYTLLWASGRKPGGIHPGTVANIRIFQGLCLLAGAAILARGYLLCPWKRWCESATGKWLKPRLDRRAILALIPIALASVAFQTVGCWRDGLPMWSPVVASSVAQSAVISCMVVLLASACAVRVSGHRSALFIIAAAWAIAFPAEALLVIYGGDRFEPAMLGLISPESLGAYLSAWTVGGLLAGASLVFASAWLLLPTISRLATWSGMARLAVWLGLIVVLQPSYFVFRVLSLPLDYFQRPKITSQRELVSHYAPDPVLRAIRLFFTPAEFRLTSDITLYRRVIERLRLPMADPVPPKLQLPPFRRVVVISCESLSLPLISRYNSALPGQLTPVLDSLPSGNLHFRTCSLPTAPGLASHFCSHPNFRLIRARRYPNSFVEILRRRGWRTVLFDSSSRYFDSADRRFADLGFVEQHHKEWQMEIVENRPNIRGWGACDRLTLSSAADYLKEHRSERVFLFVLTIDTHPPEGRTDYGNLAYPPEPAWINRFPSSAPLLRAVFRFDYDLGLFLAKLRQETLLDEECLLLITADHCMPACPQYLAIPGTSDSPYERIPFVVLSGSELPRLEPEREASQTSTAPTLFHLLGIPVPVGWWGRSLYDHAHRAPIFVGSHGHSRGFRLGPPGEQAPAVDPAAVQVFFDTLLTEPNQ